MATTGIDCPVCGKGRAPNPQGMCYECAVLSIRRLAAQPKARPVRKAKQKSKPKKTERNASTPRLL